MSGHKMKQSLDQIINDLQQDFVITVQQKKGYHLNTKQEQKACKEAFLKQKEDDKLSTVSESLEYFTISNLDELRTFFEQKKFRKISLETPLKKEDYEAIFSMKPQVKDLRFKWDRISFKNELKQLEHTVQQLQGNNKNFGTEEPKIINLKLNFDNISYDFRDKFENLVEKDRRLFSRIEVVIFCFSKLRLLKIKLPVIEMHEEFFKNMLTMIVQVPLRFLYLEKFKYKVALRQEVSLIDTFNELEKNERGLNRPQGINFIKLKFGQHDKIKRTLSITDEHIQSFRYFIGLGNQDTILPTVCFKIEQFLIERKNNIQSLILFRNYNIFHQRTIQALVSLRTLKIKLLCQIAILSEDYLMINQLEDIEEICVVSKFPTNTSNFYQLETIMTQNLPNLYNMHLKTIQSKRFQPTFKFTYVTNSKDNKLLCYNRMEFIKIAEELKLIIQINYVKLVYKLFLGQFLNETFHHNQKVIDVQLDLVHFQNDESLQQTIKILRKNLQNEAQLNLTLSLSFDFSISKQTNEAFCKLFRVSMKYRTKLYIILTHTKVGYFQRYIGGWLRTIQQISYNWKESLISIQFDNEFWKQIQIQEAIKIFSWIGASKTIVDLDLNIDQNSEQHEIVQKCQIISHNFQQQKKNQFFKFLMSVLRIRWGYLINAMNQIQGRIQFQIFLMDRDQIRVSLVMYYVRIQIDPRLSRIIQIQNIFE